MKNLLLAAAFAVLAGCGRRYDADYFELLPSDTTTERRMEIKGVLEKGGYSNVVFGVDMGGNYVTAKESGVAQ